MQKEEKLSNKGMDGQMQSINEVSLIKARFISIRVTSSIITFRDPNLYRRRKLDPIPNPLLVLLFKGKTYTPGLMRVEGEMTSKAPWSSDEDKPVSSLLDLTSSLDIFKV